METKKCILLALFTMAATMASHAQENVVRAFEKIEKSTTVHPSLSKNEVRDSTGRVVSSTYYLGFKIGSLKNGLPNLLQEAFEKDKDNAKMAFISTSPNAPRYRYQIVQKGGQNISLGGKNQSSYFILTFPDEEHQGYRHAYAAEWWNAGDPNDPNIMEGYMVIAYGETPDPSYGSSPSFNFGRTFGADTTALRILPGTGWTEQMEKLKDITVPDMEQIRKFNGKPFFWDMHSKEWRLLPNEGNTHLFSITENNDEWLANAMDRVENLSNSEWHRLFGIITQKMTDGDNSDENLVVAAGIVLQLCKHADQLDRDEKAVCISRLKNIAKKFNDSYLKDMLILSAKKLENSCPD